MNKSHFHIWSVNLTSTLGVGGLGGAGKHRGPFPCGLNPLTVYSQSSAHKNKKARRPFPESFKIAKGKLRLSFCFTTNNIDLVEGDRAVCVQNVRMHLRCAGMPSGFPEYVSGELLSRGAMSTLLCPHRRSAGGSAGNAVCRTWCHT